MTDEKHIIISLGGSLICPNDIDTNFVLKFVDLIKEYVAKGYKFGIITGGGKICRKYNDAVQTVVHPTKDDLDWLGIATTRLNAEFVRIAFNDLAYEKIILDPDMIPNTDKQVMLGGGWKPGNSSDLAAIHTAISVGAKKVINLSNIDYVYDKDPNIFPDAIKIESTNWAEFRKILPKEWNPGLNAPFDPIAAENAESEHIEVAIMNGKNLENLKNYLDGNTFIGTVIKDKNNLSNLKISLPSNVKFFKDFYNWNILKKELNETSRVFYAHPREVWWSSLGVNIGAEIDGKNEGFERTILVLNVYNKESMLVLPITSREKSDKFHKKIIIDSVNKMGQTYKKDVWVKLTQARVISNKRLLRKVDILSQDIFSEIQNEFKKFI